MINLSGGAYAVKMGRLFIAAIYEICKMNETIVRSASMLTMDAIDHPMMKDFHEPGDVKDQSL